VTPRLLKTAALVYLVKAVAFLVLWLVVPDLPHKAAIRVRDAWAHVASRQP
jgi:hypothetical protein